MFNFHQMSLKFCLLLIFLTVQIWDVLSGKQIQRFRHEDYIKGALFSPDGSKVVSCSDMIIQIWDILSGNQRKIRLFPDGTKIMSCSFDETIRLWDLLSGKQIQVLKGYPDSVLAAEFSSAGSEIISYSKDKTIQICDLSSRRKIQLEGHNTQINGIHLSPDDSKLYLEEYNLLDRSTEIACETTWWIILIFFYILYNFLMMLNTFTLSKTNSFRDCTKQNKIAIDFELVKKTRSSFH
ncbi:hypothetical protein RFI_07495 [Reticulomyxa filosa]|uniref:Uncharacterized protein n=1 Tax=Reticulomyxa filosa TaxID=46433 RepID=X6NUB7_RETFI|nr:hypothetical protein RFI_07495 [Reticulomyxa filosa]|eukprot:ETO29626.1 hypothetical protein RFI_07495 [Reticulomyxa filosa]